MARAALVLPACLAGSALGILLFDPGMPRPSPGWPLLLAMVGAGGTVSAIAAASRNPGRVAAACVAAAAMALGLGLGAWRAAATSLPDGPGTVAGLVAGGQRSGEAAVSGRVVDDSRPREDRQHVVLEGVAVDGVPLRGRILATLPRAVAIGSGDLVRFRAEIEAPHDFDGFAYRAYLARQGIGAVARSFAAEVTRDGTRGPAAMLARARSALLDGLDRIVPEPEAALGAGILLGVRTGIDPAVNDAFARAGLTHVVAISGWNIAIVAALVMRMLDPLRRRVGGRLLLPALTVAAIGGYVVLVGSSPSVVRAALMAAAMLAGRQGGSRAHGASALMLAALAMLLAAPSVLWDVGFQLSLLATAGLIAFGAGMEARLAAWPGWIREPVALTLAAQLTTLPVILVTFERLSLVAPLANVLVTPLVPLVMLACAVAAPIGAVGAAGAGGAVGGAVHLPLVGDALAWFAGGAAWLGLRAMIAIGGAMASVPFASLPVSVPAWLAAAWYPALFALRARRRRSDGPAAGDGELPVPTERLVSSTRSRPGRRPPPLTRLGARLRTVAGAVSSPRRAAAAVLVVLGLSTLASLPDGQLHLVMLDVGQGDALLVVAPDGSAVLVDGGPDPDLLLRRLGDALPWWRREIAVVILTHPHQDHVGGLPEVLRRFRVGTVLDGGRAYPNPTYERLLELASVEGPDVYRLARSGDELRLDRRTTLELLYPAEADASGPLPAGDINNASVVGVLAIGAFRALLTGDAEAPVEALLADRGQLEPVDVLKVAHHGSRSGTTAPFLAALRPAVGLVSVGAGNDYGHPSPITMSALADGGVRVLRTDLDGTIEIRTDGTAWTARAHGLIEAGHVAGHVGRSAAGTLRAQRDPSPALSVASLPTMSPGAGSIEPWPSRAPKRRTGSWRAAGCRRGSCATRRASRGSRAPPRAWSRRPASPSTCGWSRPPPCCTTSTSRRPVRAVSRTARSAPGCSSAWGSASWPRPFRRTR